MFLCTLNYCFWMNWGSEVKVTMHVTVLEWYHFTVTCLIGKHLPYMKCSERLRNSKGAVASSGKLCFAKSRLTVTATKPNVLLPPVQHQDLCRKLSLILRICFWSWYCKPNTAQMLLPAHLPFPQQSGAGAEAVSFFQVSLFGEGYNTYVTSSQLGKP